MMKRIATIVAMGMMLWALTPWTAQGQNTHCNGLQNPINFTLYNNSTTGQYTGKVGTKLEQSGNCLTGATGLSLTTDVPNNQLATVTDGGGSSYCGAALSPSNRFRIMSNTEGPGTGGNSGKDPLTNYALPYCPTGFQKSIRVGNCQTSGYAEALYYTFTVNNYNALVFINYAIVAQAPGHGVAADPQFIIRVTKQQGTNNWVPLSDTLCYTVSTTPTSTSGGTVTIGQDGWHANGNVYYRDWNQCVINLSKYYTQTVRIEVMFGDCEWQGHYGYAYVAGECRPMTLNINGCAAGEGTAVATVEAPAGMSEYKWYRSRTGVLQGSARETETNYQLLSGQTTQTLDVTVQHFITSTNDTLQQNTFKCEMTSYMDPNKPIKSNIYTEVGNTKPTISIDTMLYCDGTVTLTDKSFCRFVTTDADNVDTSLSVWKIYATPTPGDAAFLGSIQGGTVNYQFPDAGNYCVKLRTSAYDTTCWNEKTVQVRAIKSPTPRVRFERNDICSGDTIALYDETQGHTVNPTTNPTATWHQWTIHLPEGDTTFNTPMMATRFSFTESTDITLVSRTNMAFQLDSNHDGTMDTRYCFARLDTTVRVGQFPVLTVYGDTIVCNGDQTDVWVEADLHGCRFDWYQSLFGGTPIAENNSHLVISITQDRTYYVKVTSSNGCESWDSARVYIVDPKLEVPVTAVCDNTPVVLHGSNAYSYTWTAMPNDPSLVGQETNPDITVTPHQTTTYTLTGHGMNNCSATPLQQTITVYPYPVPAVQLTPDFIDSEKPTVTFRDVSEGATTSLWDFGGGHTSTERQVRHTFTDLSEDSVLVSLTTGNDLNCTSDTSFWLPVELFSLWFPNAFTPTLGTNRTFGPFTHNILEYYSLYIYNRAGQEVFQSHDQMEQWDGKYRGKYCDQGAYVYVCTYRRPGTEDVVTVKGTVMLLQ
ncbi:MAG: gliding motility-associated C-terminal domain-containing protein [Bacteroidales bacterium]|nr:gliding motility-associated C-terminal domain-containing protein [Bacteroidales bacterium]